MAGSNVNRNDRGIRKIVGGLILGGSTKTAIAAGAGGDATATVSLLAGPPASSDASGVISVLAAGTPTGSAVVASVTYGSPLNQAPKTIILTPANAAAAALSGNAQVYVDQASITKTGFNIKVGSSALSAGTTYLWFYEIKG